MIRGEEYNLINSINSVDKNSYVTSSNYALGILNNIVSGEEKSLYWLVPKLEEISGVSREKIKIKSSLEKGVNEDGFF